MIGIVDGFPKDWYSLVYKILIFSLKTKNNKILIKDSCFKKMRKKFRKKFKKRRSFI